MRIVNLGDTNSILNKFVAELRDVDIQKDSLRFRRNVERIGESWLTRSVRNFITVRKTSSPR